MYIRRLGFTLVEIMIVISIIAILGTVTFFGTQPYMSRSRDTNRISDMRSLATNI